MPASDVELRYDAFISYRRSDGSVHAQRLCRKLLDYKLPLELKDDVSRQELSIYLDTRYERADSDFFEDTIKPALRESRHLIVVQTPDALKPRDDGTPNWVEREIDYFCSLPQEGREISIALAKGDFNGPLAGDLRRRFPQIQIVDIRRLGSLRPGKSHHELLKFVGALYEVPRELMPELRQEEAQRRTARLRMYLTAAVLLVAVLSGFLSWALYSRDQTQKALSQSDLREAGTLIENGQAGQGLAFLARAIRLDPENLVARTWITDLLLRRTWPLPILATHDESGFLLADLHPNKLDLLTVSWDGDVLHVTPDRPNDHDVFRARSLYMARLSPDRKSLVTMGSSGAQLWEVSTGRLIANLEGNSLQPTADFSIDSSLLVIPSAQEILFWNGRTGRPVGVPLTREKTSLVSVVRFSPDKKHLLVVESPLGAGSKVDLWTLPEGKVRRTLTISPERISDASFNRDGSLLAMASAQGTGQVWIVASGELVGRPLRHEAAIKSIVFSPDGRKIATASDDRTARIWDASTGLPLTEPLQHADVVQHASFNSSGQQVATASSDGTAYVWNIQDGRSGSEILPYNPFGQRVVFSPDASTAASFSSLRVSIQALPSGQGADLPIELTNLQALRFSSDGRHLATLEEPTRSDPGNGRRWEIQVWEVATRKPIGSRSFLVAADLFFSEDLSKVFAITPQGKGSIRDVQTGRVLVANMPFRSFGSFSPDGERFVTSTSREEAEVWSLEKAVPIGKFPHREGEITTASFSPDGRLLVLASNNGTARVWNSWSSAPVSTLLRLGSGFGVSDTQFGPDSRFVLLTGPGRASTFDTTGKALGTRLFPDSAQHMISDDGEMVVTSENSTLHVWQPRTGELLANRFQEHGYLETARLRSDGRILYTVVRDSRGYSHSLRAWELSAGTSKDAEVFARLAETAGGFVLDREGPMTPMEHWDYRIRDFPRIPLVESEKDDDSLFPALIIARWLSPDARIDPTDFDDPLSAAALSRWFFADRSTRTLSPLSKITVPDFIRGRLARGTKEARDEVLKAYPDHPLVLEELRRAQSSPQSPN